MPDETYYSLLEISERATQLEVKAAYRNLIKQVHPDTISNLPPYLRTLAEEKSKELTEAYSVLSDASKRRQYDVLLSSYRQTQVKSGATEASGQQHAATAKPSKSTPPSRAYKWGGKARRLIVWMIKHPVLAGSSIILFWTVVVAMSSSQPAPSAKTASIASTPLPSTVRGAETGSSVPTVSAIGIGPGEHQEVSASTIPDQALDGMYVGTVHNGTADLTAPIEIFFERGRGFAVLGCTLIKPPLYGSGSLNGTRKGDQISFIVENIDFQGRLTGSHVDGSYVVSSSNNRNELGEFHIKKQSNPQLLEHCNDGVLTESSRPTRLNAATAEPLPSKAAATGDTRRVAVVTSGYAILDKRCAFLPEDNYGRCSYGPETLAQLKLGDRLRVLSPLTRAEDGKEIVRVRTDQGWVGWIDASEIAPEVK